MRSMNRLRLFQVLERRISGVPSSPLVRISPGNEVAAVTPDIPRNRTTYQPVGQFPKHDDICLIEIDRPACGSSELAEPRASGAPTLAVGDCDIKIIGIHLERR